MSDSTATTLKKVHTPVTRRLTRAQVLIFGSAAFFSIYIFEFATRNYNNPLLAGLSIAGLVFIWLFVFICARSERTLYKSSVFIDFVFKFITAVLHQLDQKIIYPHHDFKHLTEKYFEIGMKLNDFSIQLVKY